MKQTVHIFIAKDCFKSYEELMNYIHPTYSDDGDEIASSFMKDTSLEGYEPMAIETIFEDQKIPIKDLLDGVSYEEQWIDKLDVDIIADTAICIFSPNILKTPQKSSLSYCGSYDYEI